MRRLVVGCWVSAALILVTVAGCASALAPGDQDESDILTHDDLIVAIPRAVDSETAARRAAQLERGGVRTSQHDDADFYLAVRKSALGEQWFWSVYLKAMQPFGPNPATLGTKVVRFREQNGKLYVFDADNRRATSDVFEPELIIDAFPIVQSDHFHGLPGSGSYLLIDPAAGINRFGALSDFFGTAPGPIKLETELAFVQGFRPASDGGSYEQIITGYTDQPIGPGDIDPNAFRITATLGMSLRRYTEGRDYHAVAPPPAAFYFLSAPANIPNTGEQKQVAVHWGFAPGMTPIKWVIGAEITAISADPALGGADLFHAMKRGIESWNAVFGYPVFTAVLAGPGDSFADDHVNFLIVDPDISMGFAFADWRTNPNTGEIRGASVYIGGGFFAPLPPTAAATQPQPPGAPPTSPVPGLVWQDQKAPPRCVLWAPRWQPDQLAGDAPSPLTGAQQLEAYIQQITAHEIGHALGLRHNFKGSLIPPTSSVMDYNVLSAAVAHPTPGPYDEQAIRYLYGQSPQLPTAPFCTDEDTPIDPNCAVFDRPSPMPLVEDRIPRYQRTVGRLLDGSFSLDFVDDFLTAVGTSVYAYARAGTPAEATLAWQAALDGVRAPLPADRVSDPIYVAAADAISAFVYRELYLQPTGLITTPISEPSVVAAVAHDGKDLVLDGVRSYRTRLIVISALKQAQNLDALRALRDARTALADRLGGLSADDQLSTNDLIEQIDAATSPYFE